MEHGIWAAAGKFWAWLITVLPAAVGSALSIYINREKTERMRNGERIVVFLFGVSLAHYLGGAVIEFWSIASGGYVSDAIKLTVGFIGMAALAQAMIQLPEALRALRKKFIGED